MSELTKQLTNKNLPRDELRTILETIIRNRSLEQTDDLLNHVQETKQKTIGNVVHLRGLIEFSNLCTKNCFYCGLRQDTPHIHRYSMTDEEIESAAMFAYQHHYASIVLQSGEVSSSFFTSRITRLLEKIHTITHNSLGITLSCGEQPFETYQKWRNAGATRYLLRIESSNPALYSKIHTSDQHHDYQTRLQCLKSLKQADYQVGSGMMVGLPHQTISDMIDDIFFLIDHDIDMVGLGPFIEHSQTPLSVSSLHPNLFPLQERFNLTLTIISLLRILIPDINISAATALNVIDPQGRIKAVKAGANIIMPNITPANYRDDYTLYEHKPKTTESLEEELNTINHRIGYNEWGNSLHYQSRK